MAFNEALAARIRDTLAGQQGMTEKRMFGGIGFLLNGNMCCGVHKEELILRLSAEDADAALSNDEVRPFDITGRPMTGWVLVAPAGTKTDQRLRDWVDRAVAFTSLLAPK
jgi:hypothetical protein